MTLLPESVAMVELAASYVAGKWVSGAHTGTLDVTSPTTGELLGTVGIAGPTEVDSAVTAARGALPAWGRRGRPGPRRAALAAILEHVRSGHYRGRRAARLRDDHP